MKNSEPADKPATKKELATHQRLQQARQSGMRWFISKGRGILEFNSTHYLKVLLIFWAMYAGLGLLLSAFFPTQTEISCQRESATAGSCQVRKLRLHPLLLLYRPVEKLALEAYNGATVVEVVGDESDSYEVYLTGKSGNNYYLFTPWLESAAEDKAEDLDLFFKTPTETDVRIKHLSLIFLFLFDLPIWFLTLQLFIGLFYKYSGRPFNSQRVIIDPERRQLIAVKVSTWGSLKATQYPLGATRDLRVIRKTNENSVSYEIFVSVDGKATALVKHLTLSSAVPESYLHQICAEANQFLIADARQAKTEHKASQSGI